MWNRPSLASFVDYPVTIITIALSAVITMAWWGGKFDIQGITMEVLAWHGEPWRLVTAIFPHTDFMHLFFNLYWLWLFGAIVENAFGTLKTVGLFIFFAIGSNVAEYAIFDGGIGLSGLGYGLFGFLLIMSSKDRRFYGAIDKNTSIIFIVWLVLCIALTELKIWRVANIAHVSGMVLGVLFGKALSGFGRRRVMMSAALAGTFAVIMITGAFFRPLVNFSSSASEEIAYFGTEALKAGKNDLAVSLLEEAAEMDRTNYRYWYTLGIAYEKVGKKEESMAAFRHAEGLAPDDDPVDPSDIESDEQYEKH